MKQILAHTEEISTGMFSILMQNGIIPIKVTDVNSVRLISGEPGNETSKAILSASLSALTRAPNPVPDIFISELNRILNAKETSPNLNPGPNLSSAGPVNPGIDQTIPGTDSVSHPTQDRSLRAGIISSDHFND